MVQAIASLLRYFAWRFFATAQNDMQYEMSLRWSDNDCGNLLPRGVDSSAAVQEIVTLLSVVRNDMVWENPTPACAVSLRHAAFVNVTHAII